MTHDELEQRNPCTRLGVRGDNIAIVFLPDDKFMGWMPGQMDYFYKWQQHIRPRFPLPVPVGGSPVRDIADEVIAECAEAAERAKTSALIIMHQGMFNLQVCAPRHMTREEVQAEANCISVCGTSGGWQIADKDATCAQCAQYQERRHWILEA